MGFSFSFPTSTRIRSASPPPPCAAASRSANRLAISGNSVRVRKFWPSVETLSSPRRRPLMIRSRSTSSLTGPSLRPPRSPTQYSAMGALEQLANCVGQLDGVERLSDEPGRAGGEHVFLHAVGVEAAHHQHLGRLGPRVD